MGNGMDGIGAGINVTAVNGRTFECESGDGPQEPVNGGRTFINQYTAVFIGHENCIGLLCRRHGMNANDTV